MIAEAVELEEAPCPLGCSAGSRLVLTGAERLQGLPGRFAVVACNACGLRRTSPRPTLASMAVYYGPGYPAYEATRRPASRTAELVDRMLRAEALPALAPGRLLEIGCASGAFLERMARRGWEVAGIEPSATAAAACAARGFAVHAGPLETAPAPAAAEEADLVAGWMVLEHLHDPLGGLRRLRSWTRPGGWLALSVPNAACYEFRWFGEAWYPLQLPYHLVHFTPPTLRRLVEAAGWEVVRILFQPNLSDLVGSAGNRLEDRGRWPRLAQLLRAYPWRGGRLNLALLPLAYPLSLGGQTARMTVWARKSAEGTDR